MRQRPCLWRVEAVAILLRMAPVVLLIGVALAVVTYLIGSQAGWSWWAARLVALIPLAFCFFLGVVGVLVSALFVPAVWKMADAMPA